MRISSTELSSVILSQKSSFKSWKVIFKKFQKEAEAKRDGVITHKITILINLNTENVDAEILCYLCLNGHDLACKNI